MHARVFSSKIHFKVDNIVVNIFFTKKTTHSRLCITVNIYTMFQYYSCLQKYCSYSIYYFLIFFWTLLLFDLDLEDWPVWIRYTRQIWIYRLASHGTLDRVKWIYLLGLHRSSCFGLRIYLGHTVYEYETTRSLSFFRDDIVGYWSLWCN